MANKFDDSFCTDESMVDSEKAKSLGSENLASLRASYMILTVQFALVTFVFTMMGLKPHGSCTGDGVDLSCTLDPGTVANWVHTNSTFMVCVVVLTVLLVVAAQTMSFMHKKKNFSPWAYAGLLGMFSLCMLYITVYVCAIYTVSDPKVLIQCGMATTASSLAFTILLHRSTELPDFRGLAAIFFGFPVVFIVVFTWAIRWHSIAANGMMSIWQLIFGIFIWFETDFAKEHKLTIRDNFLSLVFVYFEFIVFLYCLCSQVGDF